MELGLSLVILMFGDGSPVVRVVPDEGLRRLITGFLFGTTGALIALSPSDKKAGRISTRRDLGILADGQLDPRIALSYVFAQLVGATCGRPAAPWLGCNGPEPGVRRNAAGPRLLPWDGRDGRSDHDLRVDRRICVCLGFRRLRPFTPAMFPFLYALWCMPKRRYRARARIPLAASVRRSSLANGRDGGSIGWVR